MRKFISIIVVLCISVILVGCANDQYSIERQYWKLQRLADKIFKNPDATPDRQLDLAVLRLQNFAKKYQKNPLSIDAEFTVARLYIVKQDYTKGRAVLTAFIKRYIKNENLCAEAMFVIGNSYEIEDKWAPALAEYEKILRDYPVTIRGLDLPVYIAQHYKVKYQPDKMRAAFQEAIVHYRGLAQKYPNSVLAFNADAIVTKIYLELKEWENAVSSLDLIIEKYKGKVKVDAFLLEKALIYNKQLKDNIKAKESLEALIKDYPNSQLIKTAKKLLADLDKK